MGIFDDIKKVVSKAAPLLGSAISATNPLAGVAISLLGNAFGVEGNNKKDILKRIKSDPEAALKLQKIEHDHVESLKRIAAENYKTEVEDRKDARETSVKSSKKYRSFLRWFAALVTVGFFCISAALMFVPLVDINPSEKEFIAMLVGVLVSKWQTIVDFFYGSSSPE